MLDYVYKYVLLILICTFSIACNNDKFVLEGALSDAGTKNIRAIYVNEAGVQSSWIPVESGRFKLVGVSPDYTIVTLYNSQRELITRIAIKNGDNVKLRGTIKHKYLIEMKGNDASVEWNDFRRENHRLYEQAEENAGVLDDAIETYIKDNSDKISSLLLLLNDYSSLDDASKMHSLLNMIDEKARPASLMRAYTEMNSELSRKSKRKNYHSLLLYTPEDSLEAFIPLRAKLSVMYFWGINDNDRKKYVDSLEVLFNDYKDKKQLQIADIMMDSDTARWKRTIEKEDKEWKHYWSVGGPMNKSIVDINIKKTPTFVVIDSVGEPLYKGDSIVKVMSAIRERLVKSESKKK